MKLPFLFLITLSLLLSEQCVAQKFVASEYAFSKLQKNFIKNSASEQHLYFIKEKNVLVGFTESNVDVLVKNKLHVFYLTTYSESNLKFQVKDVKNKLVGYAILNDDENYDVEIYFDDKNTAQRLGLEKIHLFNKNEITIQR